MSKYDKSDKRAHSLQAKKQEIENREINRLEQVSNWVIESKAGNVRAFEQLYREFYQRLLMFCRRMTGSTEIAEEILQESYVKAWLALPEFRQESGFYTWLRKIASRLVIDRLRLKSEKVWQKAVEFDDSTIFSQLGAEHKMDLDRLITKLPDGARNVFVLHDVEGYGHREIGLMLGIAEGTSKAQLSRARTLLRNQYVSR
ncbi:RNA polymerase sigma factor [Aliikangiella coralliicola]|uniref:RNA polymerase sigma factor n=1 Tax=Aliikangiella coralliicola TaxID=2592383 RepID=UPI00143D88C9|nr:RNA polymerase sigma factor [Aliikangiella coralliicola]